VKHGRGWEKQIAGASVKPVFWCWPAGVGKA
jgi:hypothetical protein